MVYMNYCPRLSEDLARVLCDRTFTVARSPDGGEIIEFLRNSGQKQVIVENSNCAELKLGELHGM